VRSNSSATHLPLLGRFRHLCQRFFGVSERKEWTVPESVCLQLFVLQPIYPHAEHAHGLLDAVEDLVLEPSASIRFSTDQHARHRGAGHSVVYEALHCSVAVGLEQAIEETGGSAPKDAGCLSTVGTIGGDCSSPTPARIGCFNFTPQTSPGTHTRSTIRGHVSRAFLSRQRARDEGGANGPTAAVARPKLGASGLSSARMECAGAWFIVTIEGLASGAEFTHRCGVAGFAGLARPIPASGMERSV
jgi:hypothetical protein